jgi:hypothetical protein
MALIFKKPIVPSAYFVFGTLLVIFGVAVLLYVEKGVAQYYQEREGVVRPQTEEDRQELQRIKHGRPGRKESPLVHAWAALLVGTIMIGKGVLLAIAKKVPVKGDKDAVAIDLEQPLEIRDPYLEQIKQDDANDSSIRP